MEITVILPQMIQYQNGMAKKLKQGLIFYRLHVDQFGELKSLGVLQEVMNG